MKLNYEAAMAIADKTNLRIIGDPEEKSPDDAFHSYGQDSYAWVQEAFAITKNPILQTWLVNHRSQRLLDAIALFKAVGDLEGLRCAPRVFENYSPDANGRDDGKLDRFFIFKEDNNGNTIRIQDMTAEPHYSWGCDIEEAMH